MKYLKLLLFVFLSILTDSCQVKSEEEKFKVGFSQAMTTDNWRREMNKSMKLEASMHPDIILEIKDAENHITNQVAHIEEFIKDGVDVLIVSPIQSIPITPAIEKAMAAGIPTIIIDRKIEGQNFTAYVGANNIEIGRNAAKYILSHSSGKADIIEITGQEGSSPAYERSMGFKKTLDSVPELKVRHVIKGDWEKTSIQSKLSDLLDSVKAPDYIFAHNDRMALGAWEVARSKSLEEEINIIGVDGVFGPNGGIQLVKDNILNATILYPTGGMETIKLAEDILNGENVNKNNILRTVIIDSVNVDIMQNQFNKMNQQQNDIEQQQEVIDKQIRTYNTQSDLIQLMLILLSLLLILTLWSVYLVVKLKKRKRILELNNQKIITQRNQIESFAEKLKLSNESKINFFTALSHEFKTPLTLITSSIESISDHPNKELKSISYETNLIINNSRRLLRLINELLDFRKLESGTFALKPVKTKIAPFIQSIIADFKPEALKKSIQIEFSSANEALELYIDRDMMDKVFFNILSNAFKFTPKNGSVSIFIQESKDGVNVIFKDSGIGIPKDEFQKIFDPYMQASNNKKPSSGLGLYISKQFIELHNGEIFVSSHQGTEFKISLLKGKSHLKEYEISELNTEIEQTDSYRLSESGIPTETHPTNHLDENAETVLIIEDNMDLSYILNKKLSSEFHVILSDGTNGIKMAIDNIPDVIICDLNLPDKNGFEICNELKNDLRTSHIPTIILTALDSKESRLKALKAGADNYITKPFNYEILNESLRSVLYNREKLRYYYTNKIDEVRDENFANAEQKFLKDLNSLIDNNLRNTGFSVEDLAARLKISRVQLYRKVKALLGVSISEYINSQRLNKAKNLLQDSDMNISEIAYEVGYSSPGYFSTSFKKEYGISPKELKSR
ncbi:substrate-binding domain-containing protein [Christiangramia forsetii]|uniref:histidine kinase n=2 Tax=Christiangramia forsetii TaxID=411153 RepID=A0LXA2_CHRFK|nr:substrate-binding domain-containing protein [Christiangramia forsetii]GGG27772.1 sensor histidine kinase [Christiangramia forsetii]CAL64997.1 sugar-binding sensor histidine kinase/response regulator hybrid [Christiangramia forsetii KT0803]